MNRISVLLVDDHPLFRRGLRMGLEPERDLLIVAEAADGPAALQATEQYQPDVVLLDITLPTTSGFDVARAIKRRQPRTAVIVLTMHEDDGHLFAAIRAGADAFAAKSIEMAELVKLIRHVAGGDDASQPVTFTHARLLDEVRNTSKRSAMESEDYSPLSPREIEILGFVAQGLSNKEIASMLLISDQTVKNNITSILRKLQVNDRTQAVIYALRHGWIDLAVEDVG
ncbi:MAG: response regulator transcription factor [Thermomicrobiales bacterium]